MFSIKYLYCNREFELTNHLGNVQVTISDKRIRIPNPNNNQQTAYYLPEVLTTTDYYPFGMTMPARTFTATAGVTYKFGFNDKMNDNEITGWQDYGMREYDMRIARFISVDPLKNEYPELTPYQFASNTPIRAIDLDGLESLDYNYMPEAESYKPKTNNKDQTPASLIINLSFHWNSGMLGGNVKLFGIKFGAEGSFDANEQEVKTQFGFRDGHPFVGFSFIQRKIKPGLTSINLGIFSFGEKQIKEISNINLSTDKGNQPIDDKDFKTEGSIGVKDYNASQDNGTLRIGFGPSVSAAFVGAGFDASISVTPSTSSTSSSSSSSSSTSTSTSSSSSSTPGTNSVLLPTSQNSNISNYTGSNINIYQLNH